MKLIAFSLLVTATVACTASTTDEVSTSSSATTAAPTNKKRICTSECAWRDRCGTETYAACLTSCGHDFVNEGESLREEWVSSVETCFPSLTCSQIDDACLSRFDGYESVPEVSACLQRLPTCGSPYLYAEDCYAITALTDLARANAAACLAKDCDRVDDCLDRAFGVR